MHKTFFKHFQTLSTAQVGDSSFDSDEWASVDEKISCGREQAAKGFQGLFLFHSVRLCPLLNHQVRAKKAKEGLIAFLRPTFTDRSAERTFLFIIMFPPCTECEEDLFVFSRGLDVEKPEYTDQRRRISLTWLEKLGAAVIAAPICLSYAFTNSCHFEQVCASFGKCVN